WTMSILSIATPQATMTQHIARGAINSGPVGFPLDMLRTRGKINKSTANAGKPGLIKKSDNRTAVANARQNNATCRRSVTSPATATASATIINMSLARGSASLMIAGVGV